jgi:uncharacterized surface protein with fasciclin (FAS1) repeats
VTVDGVNIIGNELLADNGVIHTINGVILHAKKQSIVDILVENPDAYSTLITAVKAVDLVETLSTGIHIILNLLQSIFMYIVMYDASVY